MVYNKYGILNGKELEAGFTPVSSSFLRNQIGIFNILISQYLNLLDHNLRYLNSTVVHLLLHDGDTLLRLVDADTVQVEELD